MNFSEILGLHEASTFENSHPDILGDGFLMRENSVYRGVKFGAGRAGGRLVEATTRYLLMPFNQLDEIVLTKHIPYVPAARLLREIEALHPGVFDPEQMPLPESYHIHEAAHILADDSTKSMLVSSDSEKILRFILCESFANTVDALLSAAATSGAHRFFAGQNAYIKPSAELNGNVTRVQVKIGGSATFKLVYLSYVHANLLKEAPELSAIQKWLKTDVPLEVTEESLALAELGQELDPLFRLQTTRNYLHLHGFKGEADELLDFDFHALLDREDVAIAIKTMAQAIGI